MIAYLDTSVVLRIVLDQPAPLREWDELHLGVASAIIGVECHRSLDRLWHRGLVPEEKLAEKAAAIDVLLTRLDVMHLDPNVLALASRSFPVPLKTLDALHLASAMLYRNAQPRDERPIFFATHDIALAKAARAMHFDVIGVTV